MTDNSEDTPSSSSGSGNIPLAQFGFLEEVPEHAWIRSVGLMVPTTDPAIVGKWTGERANHCHDVDGRLFGLQHMVREFRPPPGSSSSRVTIDGLEYWQMEWPGIPTKPEHIDSLIIRAPHIALFGPVRADDVTPAENASPDQSAEKARKKKNGRWNRLRITDILEHKSIWLHFHDQFMVWETLIKFLPEGDGSTTALVLTRKAT